MIEHYNNGKRQYEAILKKAKNFLEKDILRLEIPFFN